MFPGNAEKNVSTFVESHKKGSERFNRFQQKILLVERKQNSFSWFYQFELRKNYIKKWAIENP